MKDNHVSLTVAICASLALHVALLRQAGQEFIRASANYSLPGYGNPYWHAGSGGGTSLKPSVLPLLPIVPLKVSYTPPVKPLPDPAAPPKPANPEQPPEMEFGEHDGTGESPQGSDVPGEFTSPLELEHDQVGLSRDDVGPGRLHESPTDLVAPIGNGPPTPPQQPGVAMIQPAAPGSSGAVAKPSQDPSTDTLPKQALSAARQGDLTPGEFGLPAETRFPAPHQQQQGLKPDPARPAGEDHRQPADPAHDLALGTNSTTPAQPHEQDPAKPKPGDENSTLAKSDPAKQYGTTADTQPAKTNQSPANTQIALANVTHDRPGAGIPIVEDPAQAPETTEADSHMKPSKGPAATDQPDAPAPATPSSPGAAIIAAPTPPANPHPGVQAHVADPLPKSPSETDPFSKNPGLTIQNGRVIAAKGARIHTTNPRLLISGRVAAGVNDDLVTVLVIKCDPQGQVLDVKVAKSSGFDELDQPLMLCAYEWWVEPPPPAAGKAAEPFTFSMRCVWK